MSMRAFRPWFCQSVSVSVSIHLIYVMSRSDKLLLNLKSNFGHSIETAGIIIHRHILAKNAKIIRFKEEIDSQSIKVDAGYLKRVDLFCEIANSNSHYVRRSLRSSVTKKTSSLKFHCSRIVTLTVGESRIIPH